MVVPTSIFRENICQNRVVIVTGGGSGIGYEIASKLGNFGAKIVIMGRREQALQNAVQEMKTQGISACYYAGDVRKVDDAAQSVQTAVDAFGHVDTLINAAAGNFLVVAEELTTKGFKTVLDIDTVGTFTVLGNFTEKPQEVAAKRLRLLGLRKTFTDIVSGKTITAMQKLVLEPYQLMILLGIR